MQPRRTTGATALLLLLFATGEPVLADQVKLLEGMARFEDKYQLFEGDVSVTVVAAGVVNTPIRLRDGDLVRSKSRNLSLWVAVGNHNARRKLDCNGWQRTAFNDHEAASLFDEANNEYRQVDWNDWRIEKADKYPDLYPDQVYIDHLVFQKPIDGMRRLRLVLPGRAIGVMRHFEFTIELEDVPGTAPYQEREKERREELRQAQAERFEELRDKLILRVEKPRPTASGIAVKIEVENPTKQNAPWVWVELLGPDGRLDLHRCKMVAAGKTVGYTVDLPKTASPQSARVVAINVERRPRG